MVTKVETELGEAPPTREERKKAEKFLERARRRDLDRKEKKREFPGEVRPVPQPEITPGEPSPFPVGFTPPEGKTVEVDAKGRPTVIETAAGLRQYTPNSTMFKMGYLTSDQYLRSGVARGDKTVDATAFLPMTSEKGETLLIDKKVAFDLQSRKPRDQFEALKEMGVIEHGSRFIPTKDGPWSFQTARSVTREERFIKESAIFEQYDQKMRVSFDFKKSHIKLPDDQWVAIKDWNKLDPKFQTIGIRQGFDAMNTALLKDAKDFREVNTQLPDGTWFGSADLMAIKASTPDLYDILAKKGFGDYEKALVGAKTTLSGFHDKQKDSYDVAGALLKRKPALTDAVNILFDQKDVDRIKFEHLPGLTIGTKAEKSAALKLVPGIAAAGIAVTATPVPFDDIVYWAALGAFTVFAGLKVHDIVTEFKNKTGRKPTPADIIVVDKKGNAATALQLIPELQRIPPLVPPFIDIKGETIKPTKIEIREAFKKFDLPEYREGIKAMVPEVVFLPTPATTIEDVTGKRAGFMEAQAGVDIAEKNLKLATKTIEINWPKIIKELQEAKRQEDIKAVFSVWNLTPQEVAPAVRRRYDFAYNDYLRKRILLESARQSYVASLNPSPLMGKITPEVLEAYATFTISDAISPSISSATRQGVSTWVDAYNEAIAKGLTTTQARAAAKSATQSAIRQAVKNMVETKALTQTQIQALTRTMTQTAVRTATRVIPATRTAVRPAARVAPAEAVAPAKPLIPPPPFLLPRGGTDKQKRKIIAGATGSIAWRQGELGGKDVWHVLMYPYKSESDYLSVVGKKPSRTTVVKGPGSAFETITLRYGRSPASKVTGDIGFFDFFIEPKGKRKVSIGFKPDPKQLTTGDITIGRKTSRISARTKRITPKTPRLRR